MKQILVIVTLLCATAMQAQTLVGKWQLEKFSGDTAIIGNVKRLAKSKSGVDFDVLSSCRGLFSSNLRGLQRSLDDKTIHFTMNIISSSQFTLPHGERDKGETSIDTYEYRLVDDVINIGDGFYTYEVNGTLVRREYHHNDLLKFKLAGNKLTFTLNCKERKLHMHFKKIT
jgi:hypothetical protein